jgi:hypothetical protein
MNVPHLTYNPATMNYTVFRKDGTVYSATRDPVAALSALRFLALDLKDTK